MGRQATGEGPRGVRRRAFLAGVLGAVVAAVAARWTGRRRRGDGPSGGAGTGRGTRGPRLRPLTRRDLYGDHDLAG